MQNFQDTFETLKQSFINTFSIQVTVPLNFFAIKLITHSFLMNFLTLKRCDWGKHESGKSKACKIKRKSSHSCKYQ